MTAIQVTDKPEWGQDADGVPSLWAIFSTAEARREFWQAERAAGTFDYELDWNDTQGFGLMLTWFRPRIARAVAALLQPGRPDNAPPAMRMYRDPSSLAGASER